MTLLTNMPKEALLQQLSDGLILLLLGMGTVFIFLVILIFATKLMSKVCQKIAGAQKPAAKAPSVQNVSAPVAAKSNDAAIAAAIAAAYVKSKN